MAEQERNDIFYFTRRLHNIGNTLRMLSLLISVFLLLSIALFVLFALTIKKSKYSSETIYNESLFIFSLVVPLIGFIILFIFNTTMRRGMTYYEEVADEISWGKNREEYSDRPPIELRIGIKEFLKSTDLPFTSGPNGQAVYLAFFLLIAVASLSLKLTLLS